MSYSCKNSCENSFENNGTNNFVNSGVNRQNYLHVVRCLRLFILIFFLNGCATSSIFNPYPSQLAEIKSNVENGDFPNALKTLDKKRNSKDKTLYMLERGRISQLQGDEDVSLSDFELAINSEVIADEKARISASGTVASGLALFSNDNAIGYQASSYERVMMHHYQAINYLKKKDVEGAGVEVRRAALEQRDAMERHSKAIAQAEKEARTNNYNPAENSAQINQRFAAMYTAAGDVKNSFQNAYTFYVSGLIYELLGEPNDAYIDYKKALEIYPGNTVVQQDLLRLSRNLGFNEDYDIFSKKFNHQGEKAKPGEGELVILYEDGYVPVKEEIGIPIGARRTIHTVSFPIYRDLSRQTGRLSLSNELGVIGYTSMICDFRALAVKDLQEKLPGIVIRQVLRLIAKEGMRKTADNNLGAAGSIAAIIFNVVSERADRRSWLTLPRNAQILRVRLPAGVQELNLSSSNGERDTISVNIREDKMSILHVVGTRNQLFVHSL